MKNPGVKEVFATRMNAEDPLRARTLRLLAKTATTDSKLVKCALALAVPVFEERLKAGEDIFPELDGEQFRDALPAVHDRICEQSATS